MDAAPPPPWTCSADALLWWDPRRPGRIEGLVAYGASPVGPYRERFTAVLTARPPAARVTAMTVDSELSADAGRRHWALPKVFAPTVSEPLRAVVRSRALPFRATGRCAQPWPDGRIRAFTVAFRGDVRLAAVTQGDTDRRLPALRTTGALVIGRPR